jgi:hypothetical protein
METFIGLFFSQLFFKKFFKYKLLFNFLPVLYTSTAAPNYKNLRRRYLNQNFTLSMNLVLTFLLSSKLTILAFFIKPENQRKRKVTFRIYSSFI